MKKNRPPKNKYYLVFGLEPFQSVIKIVGHKLFMVETLFQRVLYALFSVFFRNDCKFSKLITFNEIEFVACCTGFH